MKQFPDYCRARREAARLIRATGIVRPPILPRDVAEAEGLSVRYATFKEGSNDICGFIDFPERRITVNADHSPARQAFTVAHELGHYVLHREDYEAHPELYKVLLRDTLRQASDVREKEANVFAANLLVPRNMLDLYGSYATDDQLAELFAVSKAVIQIRKAYAPA